MHQQNSPSGVSLARIARAVLSLCLLPLKRRVGTSALVESVRRVGTPARALNLAQWLYHSALSHRDSQFSGLLP